MGVSQLELQDPHDVTSALYVLVVALAIGLWIFAACGRLFGLLWHALAVRFDGKSALRQQSDRRDRAQAHAAIAEILRDPGIQEMLLSED